MSRGEGDWTDDFWDDWWDDTFGDAPWYDDNYNDSDNPLDTSNDNFTFVGTDGWGDPIYCNSDDGTYYIDIDGDGFVDSAYVYDEGDSYEPGTGEEGNPEDDIMTPIDPDPLPDPGDTSTDSDEGGSGEVEQGGDGNNQQSQSPPPAPFNEAEQKKVNSLLSILEKNHGINPSKYTIMKSNNCNVIAKIEKSGIIVLCNEFFNKPELSDIDRLATIWHEMYHFDHKHYVTEYKSALFKSGPLELWRMGVPPEIKDFIEKQIESELGINLEKLSGDEKNYYLKTIEVHYHHRLTYSLYNTPSSYYENEINTHEAEKAEFPDSEVSDSYRKERDRLIWEYTEIQKEIQKESNN